MNKSKKLQRRIRRKLSIRRRINGSPDKPRLVVYRSLKHVYAQIIDDINGITLVNASSRDGEIAALNVSKKEASKKVGELIAKKALDKDIKKIAFDRNGYRYHGRIKELAESARKSGLDF
ncbi:MAG: 50S ribosomal protein L18 [candidate division WOR-3 bacterium]|nr:50S ribosomal protein L18 [candidate division WOR-3 bacterium]